MNLNDTINHTNCRTDNRLLWSVNQPCFSEEWQTTQGDGLSHPTAYLSVVRKTITPSPRKTRSAGAFRAASPLRETTRAQPTAQRSYSGLPKRNLPSEVRRVSPANFLLSTATSNSRLAEGLGPAAESSVSQSMGGTVMAGSHDCSPIQRPSWRKE